MLSLADCRLEVIAFALLMEARLRRHDAAKGSGHWCQRDPRLPLRHLEREVADLNAAVGAQLEPEFRDQLATDDSRGRFSRRGDQGQPQISTGRERLLVDDEKRTVILAEAADVANMAMIVADAAAGLLGPAEPKTFGADGRSI
ncbi:MAG: hypothetical protein HQL38_10860 [Alphaproteobacteria bacterium]|nr:hypothetical protein [Alphaproteobacteria bacterium]